MIRITIHTGTAAFHDSEETYPAVDRVCTYPTVDRVYTYDEVRRILQKVQDDLEMGRDLPFSLMDYNGNKVGCIEEVDED